MNIEKHILGRLLLKRNKLLSVFIILLLSASSLSFASMNSGTPSELSGKTIDLAIDEIPITVDGRVGKAIAINGSVPGPLLRLREGDDVTLGVTNRLKEPTSLHWHGLLVPSDMDGVPGVSYGGIMPGATFTYHFHLKQSGTYWFHSHSGGQEQAGAYAPIIIEPIKPDPFKFDREHVVMISDWTFKSTKTIIGKLKKQSGYFNYQRRTFGEFISDVSAKGFLPTLKDLEGLAHGLFCCGPQLTSNGLYSLQIIHIMMTP